MGILKDEAILKLERVKNINNQIKHIDRRIMEFRSRIECLGIKYTDMPKPPKASTKESTFAKCFERIVMLEEEKTELLMEIDILMEKFYYLPEIKYKVLCLKHIEELQCRKIAEKLGYCESHCKRIENEAFEYLEKDELNMS